MLPFLERTWQFAIREHRPTLPARVRDSIVEASLATYQLVVRSRAKDVMSVLAKIHDHDPKLPDYLRMAIVTRKSILLRFNCDHDQSDVLIQEILGSVVIDSKDIRSHCAYGRLLLSRAENAILRKEFDKADLCLKSWEVKNLEDPSGLELQVVRLKNTVHGRISRYKGDFNHACHCLEECLQMIPGEASRYHIMHHLGDVYCELGKPRETEKLVIKEIEQLRVHGKQRSKAFRRLALPLAEAYIQQGKLDAAKALLGELLVVFEGMVKHDVPDQLGHIRLMIGLARVGWCQARCSEAYQTLEKALVLIENYRTFSEGNFYKGVIYLFLSVVNFKLHKHPEARLSLASAKDIFHEEMPRHFIPGMGSYFLEELLRIERSLRSPGNSINETAIEGNVN